MSVTAYVPAYKHRPVSRLEREGRSILDAEGMAAGQEAAPQTCGICHAKGSIQNPLMGRPMFKMDHGRPKGTLYQIRCSDCQAARVKRR
jgi:mono/diheme cytochrome c family protein